MKLTVNGEPREEKAGLRLDELILRLGLKKDAVVAEVNRKIVKLSDRAALPLTDGDQIELIQFVGGG